MPHGENNRVPDATGFRRAAGHAASRGVGRRHGLLHRTRRGRRPVRTTTADRTTHRSALTPNHFPPRRSHERRSQRRSNPDSGHGPRRRPDPQPPRGAERLFRHHARPAAPRIGAVFDRSARGLRSHHGRRQGVLRRRRHRQHGRNAGPELYRGAGRAHDAGQSRRATHPPDAAAGDRRGERGRGRRRREPGLELRPAAGLGAGAVCGKLRADRAGPGLGRLLLPAAPGRHGQGARTHADRRPYRRRRGATPRTAEPRLPGRAFSG